MFGFKKKFDAYEANENAMLAKAAYEILMGHNIESYVAQEYGKPHKFVQATRGYHPDDDREYVNIHVCVSDGLTCSDADTARVAKYVEREYMPILRKEGIDGEIKLGNGTVRILL